MRENVTAGVFEAKVQEAIDKAPVGGLAGPVSGDEGFFVFQVEQRNEERLRDFEEAREELEQQIGQKLAAEAQTEYLERYREAWTARTFCAELVLTDRCANSDGADVFRSEEKREGR